jgi:UPF0755 protein
MPRGTHRRYFALALLIVLFTLSLILAAVPNGSDRTPGSFVVKKGTKIETIGGSLKEAHLVRSKYLFLLAALVVYKGKVVAGEYELSKSMSILQIARKMASGERKMYTLRIVEGYNLYTIGDALQKAGIMEASAFLKLAKDQEFLKRLAIPSDSLEGYLAPDTYFYSKEVDVDEFLERIAARTFKLFEKEEVRQRMREMDMDIFQTISFASIVEKEAKLEGEKKLISAVFHNRLRIGMSLDADPTVIYGRGFFGGGITKADLATPTPYNTYHLKGLPKGPICSPSRSSIIAALYPAQNDALYFVSRNDGSHVFSRTMEEHNRFVTRYQRGKGRK